MISSRDGPKASNSRETHELSAKQVSKILGSAAVTPLSEREHDVLVRTTQGATAHEITDKLGISEATINTFASVAIAM